MLGAGMMGAAIAYVCAKAGIEVVLKDVDQSAAERGKGYSEKLVAKGVERGKTTQEKGDKLLSLITPTDDASKAEGADLVIEAVFEDPKVKAQVFGEIEPYLADGALLGSNTSTLPITELAEGVSRPADFIGLHFFSPVDKMPLLEIIKGEQTSEETLYRALDVAKQIKKTPIVVNDSRGFFTSRVIGTFINEGIAMLTEGVPGPTIEQASSQAGYPAPVLQLSDELNLKLMRKIRKAAHEAQATAGTGWDAHPSEQVIDAMLDEHDRPGKLEGRGFYEYEEGKRTRLWPGLREAFPPVDDPSAISLRDLEERMLFIEAIESVKCLDEGVIETISDANIGSIMGIGFPGWTGGVLQYINGYEGGLAGFVTQGADIAKTAAIKAGLPDTVAGVQLNRFCASGLEAVNIAAQKVASGWEDLVFAGGVESMSRVPMGSDGGAWAMDPETNYDTSFVPQGIGADLIATVEGFTRDDVDAYAARSQERAAAAQSAGKFANSVIPVLDINEHVVLDHDEFIRPGTTVEVLAGLKPSFAAMGEMGGFDAVALQKYHWIEKIDHVHTPGNSSGIVDGAALVAVGNERTGAELGLTPRARILATAVSGADPTIMLTGPAPASKKALAKAGLSVDDLDLVEINEAFAAVVLRFVKDMGLDMEKVNVNGGAIAMGHPLGATGGMILGTLVDELERTGGRYGLATLCIGGGMGIATVVERI